LDDDKLFVLNRIKLCEKRCDERGLDKGGWHWWATHKNIWSGSYDVWGCEQDIIDAREIPLARMKDTEEAGLIESEERESPCGRWKFEVWKLTEAGEKFYSQSSSGA
jgi:hypothetical protein